MSRSITETNPVGTYAESFLQVRRAVGVVGIVLPFVFIIGEWFFLSGSVHVRGSLSAYYHTSMRDEFVAGLSVTGFLLATFMARKLSSWGFWLSLVAGLTLLGVAFVPTERLGLSAGAPRCGSVPTPEGCSAVQQLLGEKAAAGIHFSFAATFILCLAAIAFMFAREEFDRSRQGMKWFQRGCGIAIVVLVVLAAVGEAAGARLWEFTPLYLAEVGSVWVFGASWFLEGLRMKRLIRALRPADGAETLPKAERPAEHERAVLAKDGPPDQVPG